MPISIQCPVGIATQDPSCGRSSKGLRTSYYYFFFVAEETREIMSQLGFKTMDEMIGRVDMLEARPVPDHWKAKHIDLSFLLHNPAAPSRFGRALVRSYRIMGNSGCARLSTIEQTHDALASGEGRDAFHWDTGILIEDKGDATCSS